MQVPTPTKDTEPDETVQTAGVELVVDAMPSPVCVYVGVKVLRTTPVAGMFAIEIEPAARPTVRPIGASA